MERKEQQKVIREATEATLKSESSMCSANKLDRLYNQTGLIETAWLRISRVAVTKAPELVILAMYLGFHSNADVKNRSLILIIATELSKWTWRLRKRV